MSGQVKEVSVQYQVGGHSCDSVDSVESRACPPGYKQTEVGVIPDEWNVTNIGDLAPLQRGFDLPNRHRVGGAYPVVYSNGIVNYHNEYQVRGPGVVTGRSGTIGKVHYVEDNYWPHNTALWVTRFNNAYPKYIYYLYSYLGFSRFSSGSGVPTLNRNDAHGYKLAVPESIKEQTAIANALSDVDALITSLEKLITKKRAIKTAAMQQLLTGKKRLSPFDLTHTGYKQTELGEIPEDWDVAALNNLCPIMTGNTPSTSQPEYYGDEYLFVSPADLQGQKYVTCTSKLLSKKGFSICRQYPKHSILFTCIGSTIGKCAMASKKLTSNQQINAVVPSEKIEMDYLYYQLLYTAPRVKQQAGEQAVPIVNKTQFGEHLVLVPNDGNEQKAISKALSDIDEEIERLQQRLNKTRQLKQGMMQELLTGRTRLL